MYWINVNSYMMYIYSYPERHIFLRVSLIELRKFCWMISTYISVNALERRPIYFVYMRKVCKIWKSAQQARFLLLCETIPLLYFVYFILNFIDYFLSLFGHYCIWGIRNTYLTSLYIKEALAIRWCVVYA